MSQNKENRRRLPPPRPPAQPGAEEAVARQQHAAHIRGVRSLEEMRSAIRRVASAGPPLLEVPRFTRLDGAAFRRQALRGQPFIISGIAGRWPLAAMTPQDLRAQFASLPVRARVGDYVHTAFAPDRAMRDMTMGEYLALSEEADGSLPPYVGNLGLRELNRYCHWPAYFDKMGPPRFWIGPARTVTPLHCDYDDNIFAQLWGSKRIFLAPPHHDAFLYTWAASDLLHGSPVDPEAPDFARYPLARQAALVEVIMQPGEMLYVPAGWYHQVRALSFSLSSNRWARGMPFALQAAQLDQLHKGAPGS